MGSELGGGILPASLAMCCRFGWKDDDFSRFLSGVETRKLHVWS